MLSLLVSAVVRVTQDFWQYSDEPVPSASYVFPVPAHAAVCGFEMRSQDGKVIKAVAKEREQARKEHEAAIQEGQMTGLVQHATDDGDHSFRQRISLLLTVISVFLISLGVLPAKQQLTTVITVCRTSARLHIYLVDDRVIVCHGPNGSRYQ